MKTAEEIRQIPNLLIFQQGEDGGVGQIYMGSYHKDRIPVVIWSNGGGWEHVSLSFNNRCPTWSEMCKVKDMFFRPDEVCVQYHPAQSEYVNTHPYCLHIWRPMDVKMPTPPAWMVGIKDGEDLQKTFDKAEKELEQYERNSQ